MAQHPTSVNLTVVYRQIGRMFSHRCTLSESEMQQICDLCEHISVRDIGLLERIIQGLVHRYINDDGDGLAYLEAAKCFTQFAAKYIRHQRLFINDFDFHDAIRRCRVFGWVIHINNGPVNLQRAATWDTWIRNHVMIKGSETI